jgi:hypothetical protein
LSGTAAGKAPGMTDEKHEHDETEDAEEPEDPKLLPDREAMSLIAPGGGGFAGIIPAIGPDADLPAPPPVPPGSK